MKKVYAALLSTTMVLGLAGVACAADAAPAASNVVSKGGVVTLDGGIRFRGWIQKDTLDMAATATAAGQNNVGDDQRAYDARIRFGATVKASDEVTGRILLESGDDTHDVYTWGSNPGFFDGGAKRGSMQILESWIMYKPGMAGVKVGHMPLALGNKLFFDHTKYGDDAIVVFADPTSSTHIGALTIKFNEGNTSSTSDDVDGYVLLATQKISDALKLGANWTYLHGATDLSVTTNGAPIPGLSFHNIGLTADGTVGILSYKLDGEIQTGKLIDDGTGLANSTAATHKLDAGGYALMGEISAKLDPFTIGALIGYGSGDNPNDAATNDKNKAFVDFLGSNRYQSTMVGYRLAVPDAVGTTGMGGLGFIGGNKNTGLSNLQLYQINAGLNTTCPLTGKDLALKADVNYMKLNETVTNHSDKIGTELELFADWKLANGLTFGLEGAYLWAGDAWKDAAGGRGYANQEVSNAWFARTTLNLSF